VYLAARSETRAHGAIEKLHAENRKIDKGQLVWLPLDLLDLDGVVKSAQTLVQQEERLDILGKFLL
jgi:NAD(P)-dependent dehydrogenase (short-subunit alcohol dehydrogenase family)